MVSRPDGTIKRIIYYGEITAVCFLCILLMCSILSAFPRSFFTVCFYLLYCIISLLTVYFLKDRIFRGHVVKRMIFNMAAAFIIRFIVIYFIGLTQQGDYAIYLSTARKIADGTLSESNRFYYGIFPHALNYPIFISFMYKLIGETTWLTKVINLLFGVIEAGLGTYILEKSANPKVGLAGGLAVALNPSVIIFTLLAGGEPIYSSVILCAVFFLVSGLDKKKPYLFSAVFGIAAAAANFFRPAALILIIASVLAIVIYSDSKAGEKLLSVSVIVVSYVLAAMLLGSVTAGVSGYKSPSRSYGWNLFVGANENSQGRWNEADGELFNAAREEYDDPSKVQEHFFRLGIERYKNMGIRVAPHFKRKLSIWFDESYPARAVTEWQNQYTRFRSADLGQTFQLIVSSFNLPVVLGAVIALILLSLNNKAPLAMKTLSFYMIGSMMLFMIFETATRYKGAYYSTLTLLAVYGYWKICYYIKEKYINKSNRVENPDIPGNAG
ncbi:MAG: 4-amino-4-deoxy-L-arabinose transferase [Clostridiaceae bacterium]|nr:4-amino-4-deoxy-L-arabinose transferase [Clostridiaceae bacterium]